MEQESLENTAQDPKADTSGINFLKFFKRTSICKGLLDPLLHANCCCLPPTCHSVTESMTAIQNSHSKESVAPSHFSL